MDFQRSQELMQKALQLQQLGLQDARDALQDRNLSDISHERDNLSDAVTNLSKRLAEAIELSITSDIEFHDIQTWRTDIKHQITQMKLLVSELNQAETEGRRALQEEEIHHRRAFEEEERQRELKWIRQKLECESAMGHTPLFEEVATERLVIDQQIDALPEPPINETLVSHPQPAAEEVSVLPTLQPLEPPQQLPTAPQSQRTNQSDCGTATAASTPTEPTAVETLRMMQQLLTLNHNAIPAKLPGVKLQKYSITPFS